MTIAYEAVLFDLYGTLIDDSGEAIDGAPALLRALAGASWAIVTSCPRRLADSLIAGARLPHPDVLVTSTDVARNKPAPDGYLYAARRLNVNPARTLVVEDSAHGVAAGRAAGCDVVAVLRGRSRDWAAAASFDVDRLSELRLVAAPGGVTLDLGA